MLLLRDVGKPTFNGAMSPKPGAGGKGLFLFISLASDMLLFIIRGFLTSLGVKGILSNTPAAVGDMTENARLARRSSAILANTESDSRLDIDDRGL